MNFFRQWGSFMMLGARAHAQWEIRVSNTILRSKKRCIILGLLLVPILLGGFVFADQMVEMTDVISEMSFGLLLRYVGAALEHAWATW